MTPAFEKTQSLWRGNRLILHAKYCGNQRSTSISLLKDDKKTARGRQDLESFLTPSRLNLGYTLASVTGRVVPTSGSYMLKFELRRAPSMPCAKSVCRVLLFSACASLSTSGKRVGFHAFRRYRAAVLRKGRVPEDLITLWLGHARTLTDHYATQLRDDEQYRSEWCERAGLGFSVVTLLHAHVVSIDAANAA
jgi:hypothetical protein